MNVIADINIICIGQKEKKCYNHDLINIECHKNPYCFYSEWEILSSIRGNWYQITPIKRDYGVYNDEFFPLLQNKNKSYLYLKDDKPNIDFLVNLIIFYLNESPLRKIYFMVRLNWKKEQKIIGVLKFKEFINKLENNKVLFDTAYIIEL